MLYTKNSDSNSKIQAGFMALLLCLSSFSVAKAEDNASLLLVIPSYDNTIFEDGYDRWNQNHNANQGFVIQRSILFDNLDQQNLDSTTLRNNNNGRHDRYSNHLAFIYNVTVKGYSLYQAQENTVNLWSFDKIDLNIDKKPELLLAVQKSFY